MHTSESSLDNSTSLGALLRAEREKRGLSLGEVAERLKLSLKQLSAIESDHWHQLPGTTFARGFVRSYARYLELDEQQMLQLLDASLPTAAPAANVGEAVKPQAAAETHDKTPAAASSSSKASLWAIGLVMVAVGGYSLYSKQADKPAEPVLASAPLAQQPASEALAEEQAATEVPAPVTAEASAAVPAAPVVTPAPVVVPAAPTVVAASAPAAAVVAANVAIEIRASAESWVEVRDRDGKKLIFGLVPANGSKSASGNGPLKVLIGNAQAVQLMHNGQPVDLAGKIRGSTAKLELN